MSQVIETLKKIDLSHEPIEHIVKIISKIIEDKVGIYFLLTHYK